METLNNTTQKQTFKVQFKNNRFYRRVFLENKRPSECSEIIEVELFKGMPLTYSIGSDSYSYKILDFETTLKGGLKRVIIGTLKYGADKRVLAYNKNKTEFKEVGNKYGFYHFGEGVDYRDPEF